MEKKELLEMFIAYDLEDLYGDFSDDGDGELELTEKGNEVAITILALIEQELDRAREEQFTQKELKRIEELLGFMLSDYPSSFWKLEDKSIEKKLSKLKQ